jgi:predicted amino acid dehydrogenase
MKNSYRIAEISFGKSLWNSAYSFSIENFHFEVQRLGAEFSVANAKSLITRLRNEVDAFAISGLPPVVLLDQKSYIHPQFLDLMSTPSPVPLCNGSVLREICNVHSMIQLIEEKKIDPRRGIFFPAAIISTELEELLRQYYKAPVYFGDLFAISGLPLVLSPFPGLKTLTKVALNASNFKDLKEFVPIAKGRWAKMAQAASLAQAHQAHYICCDLSYLMLYDSSLDVIRNKEVIVWSDSPAQRADLESRSPQAMIQLIPEGLRFSDSMNYPVLDAALRIVHGKTADLSFKEWEELLSERLAPNFNVTPLVRKYASSRRESTQSKISAGLHKVRRKLLEEKTPDFAFIVHALSHHDFEKFPVIGPILKKIPEKYHDGFDRLAASAPPIVYGEIRNIISESSGKEVNGLIYALSSTPKVMKERTPEETYAKIESVCRDAAARGAKIIGLGAYTKVIGDSGVTAARNSPIPLTTGNSLSASATLWGLYEVVKKLGFLKLDPNTRRIQGLAMIVGATGSIGSVSAKLLSMAFDRICLVAPRLQRLEELKAEINRMSPHCDVQISTSANDWAGQADVLVTATSAVDHKIVDMMRLKPGCVVCDCSRPLDFTFEDAKLRPDVLIIESGELILPGPYEMTCDLGLPGKTVYACLAETALLALEERYDTFTLGRDIDWLKVKEIYKMSKKHGVRLSAIQSHGGFVSDKEIELIRQHVRSVRS